MRTPERGHNATVRTRGRQGKDPVKVIVVTSGKGGVGKTTIAANLAVGLAQRGRRVMLMDADLSMANLAVVLGLQPRQTLDQVLAGSCGIEDIIMEGPGGIIFVPAVSGNLALAGLDERQVASLIAAFDELPDTPDVLVLDSASGLSTGALYLAQAAHEILIILCDEPTSISDAYSVVKAHFQFHGIDRFRVVTNMARDADHGTELFRKFLRVTSHFLDVSLDHAGSIPADPFMQRAVQRQEPVLEAFPGARSSVALARLAEDADRWNIRLAGRGGLEFFLQRSLRPAREAATR